MIAHYLICIMAAMIGFCGAVAHGVRRSNRRLAEAKPASPAPARHEPRDKRPWLRDVSDLDDPADPRLTICPVCGMDGDEVTLDGTCIGAWPAHEECAEFLGDWKSSGVPPVPRKLPAEAQQIMGQIRDLGGERALREVERQIRTTFGIPFPVIGDTPPDADLTRALQRGLITIREARDALGREDERRFKIASVEAVQQAAEGIRTSKQWCLCGTEFDGTAEQIRTQRAMHDQECRYKVHPAQCPCGQPIAVPASTLEALFHSYQERGFCPLHGRS